MRRIDSGETGFKESESETGRGLSHFDWRWIVEEDARLKAVFWIEICSYFISSLQVGLFSTYL